MPASTDGTRNGCPSCDYGLWNAGHECYTYDDWHAKIRESLNYEREFMETDETEWVEADADGKTVHVKVMAQTCALCQSKLLNKNGWPASNWLGCRDSYHDGGYGSSTAPGYCGTHQMEWFRRPGE